ncbi:MAG: formylglycine-generating enzyme family protein, partial [Deltaproteobacteria bacterium]
MTKALEMRDGRHSRRWCRVVPILPLCLWLCLCLWLLTPALPGEAADPVVANVVVAQRAGTKLVDITYDVSDADGDNLTVSVQVSSDSGATYTVPATRFSGDYGAGVRPGSGKKIVWDAGADWNQQYSPAMRFKVTANDGVSGAPGGMVLIPAGSFKMGGISGEGYSDELPVHTVTLSAFYLDKYEVTKALWDEVKTWATAHGYSFDNAGAGTATNHPVQTVSWYDVIKWLNARSEKEGRTAVYYTDSGQTKVYRTGQVDVAAGAVKWSVNGYRLPTEAEWEYAARAGTTTRFYTGNCISADTQANYNGGYPWTGCPTGKYR